MMMMVMKCAVLLQFCDPNHYIRPCGLDTYLAECLEELTLRSGSSKITHIKWSRPHVSIIDCTPSTATRRCASLCPRHVTTYIDRSINHTEPRASQHSIAERGYLIIIVIFITSYKSSIRPPSLHLQMSGLYTYTSCTYRSFQLRPPWFIFFVFYWSFLFFCFLLWSCHV